LSLAAEAAIAALMLAGGAAVRLGSRTLPE